VVRGERIRHGAETQLCRRHKGVGRHRN
jgi:hypothetical protein